LLPSSEEKMEQANFIKTVKKIEKELATPDAERTYHKIPCKRACRIVDGKMFLIHSPDHQDRMLRKYWQTPERPGCEHCGKPQRIIGFYMRLYGLCDDCYAKSKEGECDDFVISEIKGGKMVSYWEERGGRYGKDNKLNVKIS